ncbi:MAG TPA: hypothetical protein VK524_21650 [Polyangiaceae bacterium]|nr:hypothetical protein [Polyangiaceae bacterium]
MRAWFESRRGKERGWKEWAAGLIGCSPEYVGMLHGEDRDSVGGTVVRHAIENLVSSAWFYDPLPDGARWLEYLNKDNAFSRWLADEERAATDDGLEESDNAAYTEFLGTGSHAPVNEEERARLRSWARGSYRKGGLTVADFGEMLDGIRGRKRAVGPEPAPTVTGPDDPRTMGAARAAEHGGMQVRKAPIKPATLPNDQGGAVAREPEPPPRGGKGKPKKRPRE